MTKLDSRFAKALDNVDDSVRDIDDRIANTRNHDRGKIPFILNWLWLRSARESSPKDANFWQSVWGS